LVTIEDDEFEVMVSKEEEIMKVRYMLPESEKLNSLCITVKFASANQ
jgi:hypothetical protein